MLLSLYIIEYYIAIITEMNNASQSSIRFHWFLPSFRAGEAAAAAAASELWGAGGSAQAAALPRGGGAQVDGKRVPTILSGTTAWVPKARGTGSVHVAETTCQATPVAESQLQQPQHHQQLDPNRGRIFLACRYGVLHRANSHRSF